LDSEEPEEIIPLKEIYKEDEADTI